MCEYRDRRKEELTRETAAVHTELKSEERVEDGLYRQQTQKQDEGFENPVIWRGEETQEGITEAVPVCASAPVHLDAHVRTESNHRLKTLRKEVNDKIDEISKMKADGLCSEQAVKVLIKFRSYANLRIKSFSKDPGVTLNDIDAAAADIERELSIFRDMKHVLEREYQDFLVSATRTVTTPDAEKVKELTGKLTDIAALEPLLEPYSSFMIFDRYKGGLEIKGPIMKYDDAGFTLAPQETEDIDGDIHDVFYEFESVYDLPLFPVAPCIHDIRQGGLGDCYLLAGLASAVATDPDLIINAMRDMGDKVQVRFYQPGGAPLYVEVDKTIPKKYYYLGTKYVGQMDAYAENCLWVQMMEKAYVASGLRTHINRSAAHSYEEIEGGYSEDFLEQLTGRPYRSENMANRDELEKGNSLIGVYKTVYESIYKKGAALPPEYTAVLDKMLPVTTPVTLIHGIDTEILRQTAVGIMLHSASSELSIEGAVLISMKLAEDEENRVRPVVSTSGTVRGLKRAAYLDDLKNITGISIPVPASQTLNISDLDRLAGTAGITINPAGGGLDELFDQLDEGVVCSEETKKLAERIQEAYRANAFFVPMNDAIRLAADYEVLYKERLAAEMIKKLKKDSSVNLSYSPFYTRISTKTGIVKNRYTRRAKEIYKFIEDAIAAGKMVTAGTVDYHQNGDKAVKKGLVEGHAYSVLGTKEKDGVRYVRIRNPWGRYERTYDHAHKAKEDTVYHAGVFFMELNDFVSKFSCVSEN